MKAKHMATALSSNWPQGRTTCAKILSIDSTRFDKRCITPIKLTFISIRRQIAIRFPRQSRQCHPSSLMCDNTPAKRVNGLLWINDFLNTTDATVTGLSRVIGRAVLFTVSPHPPR